MRDVAARATMVFLGDSIVDGSRLPSRDYCPDGFPLSVGFRTALVTADRPCGVGLVAGVSSGRSESSGVSGSGVVSMCHASLARLPDLPIVEF